MIRGKGHLKISTTGKQNQSNPVVTQLINQFIYKLPQMTVRQLTKQLKKRFPHSTIRVVGDPDMQFTNASLVLGAAGSLPGSPGSSASQSTAVTRDATDPTHNHSQKVATADGSPQASTSTRPSGRFRA